MLTHKLHIYSRGTSLFVVNTDYNYDAMHAEQEECVSFELLIFMLDNNNLAGGSQTTRLFRLKFDGSTKFLEVNRAIAKLNVHEIHSLCFLFSFKRITI